MEFNLDEGIARARVAEQFQELCGIRPEIVRSAFLHKNGCKIWQNCHEYPEQFDEFKANVIRKGIQSGVAKVLHNLADEYDQDYGEAARNKKKG